MLSTQNLSFPFGLLPVSSVIPYFMNDTFQDLLAHFATACLADFLNDSQKEAAHTEQGQMALAALHQYRHLASPYKYRGGIGRVALHGHAKIC